MGTGKGMKGLRGYVKPQGSPFAPGYTDVHPPVHLVRIARLPAGKLEDGFSGKDYFLRLRSSDISGTIALEG